EVDEIWVDEAQVQKKMEEFLNKLSPGHHCAVRVFQGPGELFDKFHVELEVSRALERKIWLKSGGYIVFDEAEALVVIDVNTGKYVGKKDFEDTIFKTNLEAAKEIAHQIRLRNIGGIIVVDFIDMKDPGHREKVLETLAHELKKDRARTQVMSMSSLGLVEITRKRTRPSLNKQLTRSCTYCEGKGFIKRPGTVGLELMRELEKHMSHPLARQMGSKIQVQCHPEVMDWLYEHTMTYIQGLEAQFQKVVEYESRGDFHREQFEVSYVRES
ncbi:MAG: ribonuclease E/G, partial [Bdellovibrionaceae bacterium]|nr:ribonuclease E/G [Pseudobdellovibrionaceae bacterium]